VKRPEPIEDYYGTEFEVDCAYKSAGPAVYLERTTTEPDPATQGGFLESFDRFTLEQARELAKRLNDAADLIEGRS
jgi:hypothetical protein